MALLALCYLIVATYVGYLLYRQHRLNRARNAITYRIHVHGNRGKEGAIRYIAAILREAGVETYAKLTAPKRRIILPDGSDIPLERHRGMTSTNEQVDLIRNFAQRKAGAIVIERTATRPAYQERLEHQIMRSNIAIITNVRAYQHEKVTKATLKTARQLARWLPRKAYVVTAEQHPRLLRILAEACQRKQSQLVPVTGTAVKFSGLQDFNLMAYPDNLAIAMQVAEVLHIPPDRAMQAVATVEAAAPDQRLEPLTITGRQVVWANLFGVIDNKSFSKMSRALAKQYPDYYRLVLLNTHRSRPEWVERFTKLAQSKLQAQTIAILGGISSRDEPASLLRTLTHVQVFDMGNASMYGHVSGDVLLDHILSLTNQPKVLIVGVGNVRTVQSDQILRFIRKLAGRSGPPPKEFPYV